MLNFGSSWLATETPDIVATVTMRSYGGAMLAEAVGPWMTPLREKVKMELADPPHHLHEEPLVPTGSMISKEENGSVGGRRGEIHSSAAGVRCSATMITSTEQ